jgi:acyl-CoA thioesterase
VATTPTLTAFERDTAVAPVGDGVWQATISDQWAVPRGPNGGYIAAIVLRALQDAVGDADRAPRSLTLHYLRPPVPGQPATVAVAVERAGRSLTTLSARLIQDDHPMVIALAAFATTFPSIGDYATPAPDVGPAPGSRVVAATPAPGVGPAPGSRVVAATPAPGVGAPPELRVVAPGPDVPPIAGQIATWRTFGPKPFSGGDEALAGGWLRLAEPRIADAAAVAFYADAWIPSPWGRLTALAPAPTIDLTIHFRARLPHAGMAPDDPVLARFSSTTSHDGFFEEDGAIWAPDGTLLAQSRQLGLLFPSS